LKLSHTALVILALCPLVPAEGAFALTRIEQSVELRRAGAMPQTASHIWHLDAGKFHLRVTTELSGEAQFVFNGKTFWVCRKLTNEQVKALVKVSPLVAKDADKLLAGVCQAAPGNFMARFLLSPVAAVEGTDRSDGLELSLSVPKFEVTVKNVAPGGSAGHPCALAERSLEVRKESSKNAKKTSGPDELQYSVRETICQSTTLEWSNLYSKEVQRFALQQMRASHLLPALKKAAEMKFIVSSEGEVKLRENAVQVQMTRTLTTQKIAQLDRVEKELFAIPKGWVVFDPRDALVQAAAVAKSDTKVDAKGASADAPADSSALDTLRGMFFSVLSYGTVGIP
jgi:hypothetical protein